MSIIYVLIPLSMLLSAVAIAIFFWAIKHDQFEDLEGPAHKIIFDEREAARARQAKHEQ